MEYKNKSAFINRESELRTIKAWIDEEPKNILFLYGPKSSGKTTLLYKLVDHYLGDSKVFSVKYFNLRELLIVNYSDFIHHFFTVEESKMKSGSKAKTRPETEFLESKLIRQYALPMFKLTAETHERLKEKRLDPFNVMKGELQKLKDHNIKPVIIIDELQALEFIYFNSQRELINELINFFVAMTKESHLCHVILSSSDGYFIEKLYNESKLKKTSKLFEVDYLPKVDIVYWLTHLKKESNITDYFLNDSQIEYIWDHFGGSIWEISTLLGDLLRVCRNGRVEDDALKKITDQYMIQAKSYFEDFAANDQQKTQLLKAIYEKIINKGFVKELFLGNLIEKGLYPDKHALRDELNELVKNNFLYYNPTSAQFRFQGKSMERGLMLFLEEVDALE